MSLARSLAKTYVCGTTVVGGLFMADAFSEWKQVRSYNSALAEGRPWRGPCGETEPPSAASCVAGWIGGFVYGSVAGFGFGVCTPVVWLLYVIG
jgi:hypothetical protein